MFHPGDQIFGNVAASGPIHTDNIVVWVNFRGESKTEIKRSSGTANNGTSSTTIYHDTAVFFNSTNEMFQGPCKIEKSVSIIWPFAFHLPLYTEPENGNPDIVYSPYPNALYSKGPHLLPPSISLVKGLHKAFITYELSADLKKDALFSRSLHTSIILPVAPRRIQVGGVHPDPRLTTYSQTLFHATSRLLPDHSTESRALREWISDTFARDTPCVFFTVQVRAAKTIIAGQAISKSGTSNINRAQPLVRPWEVYGSIAFRFYNIECQLYSYRGYAYSCPPIFPGTYQGGPRYHLQPPHCIWARSDDGASARK